jgi:hypothetical protein
MQPPTFYMDRKNRALATCRTAADGLIDRFVAQQFAPAAIKSLKTARRLKSNQVG